MDTWFELIGGAAPIRALVDRFYDLMDSVPAAREIRAMHPASLSTAREKLYLFLVGWSGGPPLYVERHGHPRLRARHLPFAIGDRARDQWMHCMTLALEDTVADLALRRRLVVAFGQMASHMRNTRDEEGS